MIRLPDLFVMVNRICKASSIMQLRVRLYCFLLERMRLSKQLTIKEAVILQGTITDKDSTILIAADDWSGSDGSSKHLVSIQAKRCSF